MDFKGV